MKTPVLENIVPTSVSNPWASLLFNNTSDFVLGIDAGLNYLFFNNSYFTVIKNILGIEIETGNYVFDGIKKEYTETLSAYINRGLKGESFKFEFSFRLFDTKTTIECSLTPLKQHNQTIAGVGIICHDISERVLNKEQILRANEYLTLTQKVAKMGSWNFNTETMMLSLSPEKLNVMGITPGNNEPLIISIEEYLKKYVHPEDVEFMTDQISASIANINDPEKVTRFEYRLIDPIGNIRNLEVTGVQLREGKIHGVTQDITERKKTEYKVMQAKQQLHSIIENTNDAIWLVDSNAAMLVYNSSARELLQKFYGINFHENATIEERLNGHVSKGIFDEWIGFYKEALRGKHFSTIYKVPYKDEELYFETTFNPVTENDKVTGVSVVSHDITAQKIYEDQLKQNNSLLNSVIESPTKTIIFSLDKEYCYTSFNSNHFKTMKAIWGVDIEVSKCMLDYINNDSDKQKAKQNFDKALKGDSFKLYEEYGDPPNRFYYEDAYNPIVDSDGNVSGLTVFLFDVTENKLAELALRESENRLGYAMAATGEGVWDWNIVTNTLTNNQAWHKLLGYGDGEFSGTLKDYLECLPNDEKEEVWNEVQQCINKKTPIYKKEHSMITRSGELIWVLDRGKVVEWDSDGNATRMVGSLTDITDRKKQEQERARLIEELTRRNQDLEQFTYIISHNLRAPVAKILGVMELTKENFEDKETINFVLETLTNEVTDLDEVIRDLNMVISIRNNQQEKAELVNLKEITEKVIHSLKDEIEIGQVNLEIDFSELSSVFGIKSYIHSILLNLISNSIKYRKQNLPLSIKVKTSLSDKGVCISVIDNGLGIDLEKNREKLFGLYKRFHHHVQGKGMGLYITKTQVEMMGGSIDVYSNPGKGTRFEICLPS